MILTLSKKYQVPPLKHLQAKRKVPLKYSYAARGMSLSVGMFKEEKDFMGGSVKAEGQRVKVTVSGNLEAESWTQAWVLG